MQKIENLNNRAKTEAQTLGISNESLYSVPPGLLLLVGLVIFTYFRESNLKITEQYNEELWRGWHRRPCQAWKTNQVKGEIPQGKLPEVKAAGMDDNYVP